LAATPSAGGREEILFWIRGNWVDQSAAKSGEKWSGAPRTGVTSSCLRNRWGPAWVTTRAEERGAAYVRNRSGGRAVAEYDEVINRGCGGLHYAKWKMPRTGRATGSRCHRCGPVSACWAHAREMALGCTGCGKPTTTSLRGSK